jgi:(p)ppGpp synthase/HD superfamily hydrolase
MMLSRMIRFATHQHGTQTRKKNGRPYVHDHCLKLLQRVCCDYHFIDDEAAKLIIVGHDIVEDCTENDTDDERSDLYRLIANKFSAEVSNGIRELTNEYTKKRYPELNRRKRKEKEFARLAWISVRGKRLKLHDRLLNLQDSLADKDYNKTYADESIALASAIWLPASNDDLYGTVIRLARKILDKA